MKIFFSVIMLFCALILSSCATLNNFESVSNNEISVSEFKNILVIANFNDLKLRRATEEATIKEFTTIGKKAFSALSLLPPVKEYTEEQVNAVLVENEIDCIVDFSLLSQELTSSGTYLLPVGSMYMGVSQSYYRQNFEIKVAKSPSGEIAIRATGESASSSDVANNLATSAFSLYNKKQKQELIEHLCTEIKQFDNSVEVTKTDKEIVLKKASKICNIKSKKHFLTIEFFKKAEELCDNSSFLTDNISKETGSFTSSSGTIKNANEIETVLSFIKKAIELDN